MPFIFLDKPISTKIITDSLTPVENSPVKINCSATAEPDAKYKFYQVTNASSDIELTNNVDQDSGVLDITSISALADSYNLTYKCVPYNLLGDGPSDSITLDVQGKSLTYAGFFLLWTSNLKTTESILSIGTSFRLS